MKCFTTISSSRRLSTAVLLAVFFQSHVFAQQAPTLKALAESAIRKSYDISNNELTILADKETKKSIRETYLPRVEANGKYAYLNNNIQVDIPTATLPFLDIPLFDGNSEFTTRGNLWTTDLTASAILFSGTKVPKLAKAVDYKIQAHEHLLEKQRQAIINEVSTVYDQLALLKEVRALLAESEKRLAIEKQTAEKAFGYGLITSYELNKVDVAQATLATKLQEYEGKRGLLLKQLHQLTGIPISDLQQIDEELHPYLISDMRSGVENRPEIAALDAAIEANNYRLAAEKTHWIPKVQALAKVGYYGLTNTKINTPYQNPVNGQDISLGLHRLQAFPSYTIGIGVKWDIFDGFNGKRQVNKARIEVAKAENNRQQAGELLNLNLDKAQVEYRLANEQIAAGEVRKSTAQKGLQLAQKEYKVGLIKVTDRIAAETDYQQAAFDYYQAVFDQRRAARALLLATGELTIEQLATVNTLTR